MGSPAPGGGGGLSPASDLAGRPAPRRLSERLAPVRGRLALTEGLGLAGAGTLVLTALLLAEVVARVFLGGATLETVTPSLAALAVLDRGRLVEAGTHAELLEGGGLYRRMYELQLRGTLGDASHP